MAFQHKSILQSRCNRPWWTPNARVPLVPNWVIPRIYVVVFRSNHVTCHVLTCALIMTMHAAPLTAPTNPRPHHRHTAVSQPMCSLSHNPWGGKPTCHSHAKSHNTMNTHWPSSVQWLIVLELYKGGMIISQLHRMGVRSLTMQCTKED